MRCRNCGSPDHRTNRCTEFGPWFPEEGKTKIDYCEVSARIDALIAGDIITEHNTNHPHNEEE